MKSILPLFAAISLQLAARATEYSMPWSTVDGGGGTCSSNDRHFSLSGTAGQPDAGTLAGDDLDLFGGFWSPQSACDCYLTIRNVDGAVVVTWPATYRGCTLEITSELNSPTVWTPVTATLVGDTYTYHTAPIEGTARFFRLSGL